MIARRLHTRLARVVRSPLLDELADADARADRLESRVEDLENQLEAARENPQANDHDRDRVDATEGIDGLDLNTSTRPDYRGR